VRKPVSVSLSASAELKAEIDANREIIELLATATLARVEPNLAAPANAARATAGGVEIFIEGLIDPEAERQRAAKQCETLKQKVTALRGRLANPAYTEKAPAHLVQQTRDELAGIEAELQKLGCS
jgi:valyl-tRNA synthetase